MIKYIGSKRQLIPMILKAIKDAAPQATSVIDLFSGTARVGHALKAQGYQVFANDHNAFAYTLAKCYVETDLASVKESAEMLIKEFNSMQGSAGYFTQKFCLDAQFFHPKNGERIDVIRQAIAQKNLSPNLEAVLLVSLMEAADRVDSTCGVQMSYLKSWAPRALQNLELRLPNLLVCAPAGSGKAHKFDALEATNHLEADVAYLDPPYNQHSYRSNYHIWESLVLNDKPEVYGKAQKRLDCKEIKSDFNSKTKFYNTFAALVSQIKCKTLVVSFSNEGFISKDDMKSILSPFKNIKVITYDYKRYVGAQIGIFNQKGEKVGRVKNLYNKEYLFVAR